MSIRSSTTVEGILQLIAATAIYSAPWAPLIGQLLVHKRYPASGVGIACLILIYLALWFHERSPKWTAILSIPYWAFLTLLNIVFGYMARWEDPLYFWISVGLALIVLLQKIGSKIRPYVLTAGILFATIVLTNELRFHSAFATLICSLTGIIALAGIFWLSRKNRLAQFSQLAVAFFLFSSMVYPRGAISYGFVFPKFLSKILSQPGVKAVYTYQDKRVKELIGTQAMFLARVPGSETFVVGPQTPGHHLCILAPGEPVKISCLDIGTRGADNIAFDSEKPTIAYIGTVDRLLKASTNPPMILKAITLKRSYHNLNFIHYDSKADRLFISQDFGHEIFIVDRKSLNVVGTIPCAGRAVTDDVWPDLIGNLVFVSGTYPVGWRADTYDATMLERQNTYLWRWDIGFHFSTIDPISRRAYLASTTSGWVKILDLDTLREVGAFRLEVGLRNLNFDSVRRWVLITSYFRGNLYVYDTIRKQVIGKLFLGTRLRWVEVDKENEKWYATSSAGGFEISPDVAFHEER